MATLDRENPLLNNDDEPSSNRFAGFPPSGSTLCPKCDYDLQGLPASHACPECGFEYDSYTRVWRDVRWKQRLKRGVNIVFFGLGLLLLFGSLQQFWAGSAGLGVMLFFQAAFGGIVVTVLNPPHTIAVTPAGILRRRPLWPLRCTPWAKIDDAIIKFDGRQWMVQLLDNKRKETSAFNVEDLFINREDCEGVLRHYVEVDEQRRRSA